MKKVFQHLAGIPLIRILLEERDQALLSVLILFHSCVPVSRLLWITVHQFSQRWGLPHCTTQPFLRAASPSSATALSQVSTANPGLSAAVPESQTEPSWVSLGQLQRAVCRKESVQRSCGSTALCIPDPSALRASMVHLTGCLQHYTALLATGNPQTPSNPQTSPIYINLQPNIFIWADIRKELHPETMWDEQLQISWLFTLFCIQEFSAGIDNLKQCLINKIEHKERKTKPQG